MVAISYKRYWEIATPLGRLQPHKKVQIPRKKRRMHLENAPNGEAALVKDSVLVSPGGWLTRITVVSGPSVPQFW